METTKDINMITSKVAFIFSKNTFRKCRLILMVLLFTTTGMYSQSPSKKGKSSTYRKIDVKDEAGKVVSVTPVAEKKLPMWAKDVSRQEVKWNDFTQRPYFMKPIPFVIPPAEGSGEPFYPHNHQPAITWADNGDLLAVWYTCITEQGTELTVVASRLRAGSDTWDPSSEFFKGEGRNMHGSNIFNDGNGRIFHFNGMGAKGVTKTESKELAMVYRVSEDNGVSWTSPVLVSPEYKGTHQPVSAGFVTSKGVLLQVCDSAKMKGSSKSALFASTDGGKTWRNPADDKLSFSFEEDTYQGRSIAGIHAGVVELSDGRLMALGRRNNLEDRMPVSYSNDMGATWKYKASPFPPIGGGQRLVLMRLKEGPILLISFTDIRKERNTVGLTFTDQNGGTFRGYGLFAAVSYDDGETWPIRKLITPGEGEYDGGGHTGLFNATPSVAEHAGYLAATQSPDGIIHLLSSRLHYRFNLAWLKEPNQAP